MKKLFLLCVLPLFCIGQKKIKLTKDPVAWTYEISPSTPLDETLRTFSATVNTKLDPMDFWDDINWAMQMGEMDLEERARLRRQAAKDTIAKWSKQYLLNSRPFLWVKTDPDFYVELSTDTFKMEHVQLDVDYSNPESIMGEINVAARLLVKTAQDEVLLDKEIRYYIDDKDGLTNKLRLRHLVFNPSFKLKYKMTKKPEKKRKLLEKRIKKYEADILEYFIQEAGRILKEHYLVQQVNAYSAMFGVKSKDYEALNDASEIAKKSINSLSALSKKKRKQLNEIKPDLEYARDYWTDKLTRTTDSTIQNVLNANLSAVLLILGDIEAAKFHIKSIPEYEELGTKTIWDGSFTYYLQGLANAIALKEHYGVRAQLYKY
ncbi:hypothetical protein [Flagellimonas eckloniae]|uniref:Uncharacterized protein n=1 Tax=Flagellimonas eckloniae TaxID=346185 RepID=A0A0Q1H5X6_9FLAO|nr:hypothetical protein [Allomuricauda eckloniae]KQC28994.1 hypothetical protein AAY42_03100 [Allomuricauda eckloniae]